MRHFCFWLFLHSLSVLAQTEVLHRPRLMGVYDQVMPLYNPALAGQTQRYDIWSATQMLPGENYFSAHFHARFKRPVQPGTGSVGGMTFFTEREGPILSKNAGYLLFARHQKISQSALLSAGVSVGLMSYTIGPNQSPSGSSLAGTSTAPDASLGISFWGEGFHVGVAMIYAFNSALQPNVEITRLSRHYNFSASRIVKVNDDFELYPSLLFRYGPDWYLFGKSPDLAVGMYWLLQSVVRVGATYQQGYGVTFAAGIQQVKIGDYPFDMMVGYTFPFDRSALRTLRRLEFTLRLRQEISR